MNITIPKRDLLRIIGRAASVADKKSTMPILSSCLLVAANGRVESSATDLTMTIATSAPCDVSAEGRACIPAKHLFDRVKALPDAPVKIVVANNRATITSPGSSRRFQIATLPAEEYPPIDGPGDGTRLPFAAADLARTIGRVIHAADIEGARPGMNGVHMRWIGGVLRAAATDGRRLAVDETKCNPEWSPGEIMIPLRAAVEIRSICDGLRTESGDTNVFLVVGDRTVYLLTSASEFGARIADGAFPPIEQVIPKAPKKPTTISRVALLDAIKAASISIEAFGGVTLGFADGLVTVKGESGDGGEGAEDVPCDHHGERVKIAVASRIMLDALGSFDADEIALAYRGELDPVVVRAGSQTAVVMPMRQLPVATFDERKAHEMADDADMPVAYCVGCVVWMAIPLYRNERPACAVVKVWSTEQCAADHADRINEAIGGLHELVQIRRCGGRREDGSRGVCRR